MGTRARALLAWRNTRPPNDAEIDTEIMDVYESMLNRSIGSEMGIVNRFVNRCKTVWRDSRSEQANFKR